MNCSSSGFLYKEFASLFAFEKALATGIPYATRLLILEWYDFDLAGLFGPIAPAPARLDLHRVMYGFFRRDSTRRIYKIFGRSLNFDV